MSDRNTLLSVREKETCQFRGLLKFRDIYVTYLCFLTKRFLLTTSPADLCPTMSDQNLLCPLPPGGPERSARFGHVWQRRSSTCHPPSWPAPGSTCLAGPVGPQIGRGASGGRKQCCRLTWGLTPPRHRTWNSDPPTHLRPAVPRRRSTPSQKQKMGGLPKVSDSSTNPWFSGN